MNTEMLKPVAVEVARKLNTIVNIPFISEEQEQAFFEMIVLLVLETVMVEFGKNVVDRANKNK